MHLSKPTLKSFRGKNFKLVTFMVLVFSLPVTILLAQTYQNIINKAANPEAVISVDDLPEVVPGVVLVRFRAPIQTALDGDSTQASPVPSSLASILDIETVENVFEIAGEEGAILSNSQALGDNLKNTYRITYKNDMSMEALLEELSQMDEVAFAEPDYYTRISASPNDPYYLDSYPQNIESRDLDWAPTHDYQWNLKRINIEQAWSEVTNGDLDLRKPVTVAVLDTGVSCGGDLQGQCEEGFVAGEFIDGYGDSADRHGHGTAVAGIIAAKANNEKGIAGINDRVRILPIKVIGEQGVGFYSHLATGVSYAVAKKVDIINISLGTLNYPVEGGSGFGPLEPGVLEASIQLALDEGIVVVASAGEEGREVIAFPARLPGVMAVGASGEETEYSENLKVNFGKDLDVLAPGENILSVGSVNHPNILYPNSYSPPQVLENGKEKFSLSSGSSLAVAHVTGLASLILSTGENYTTQEVTNIILNGADNTEIGFTSFNHKTGHGRINAGKSLKELNTLTPITAEPKICWGIEGKCDDACTIGAYTELNHYEANMCTSSSIVSCTPKPLETYYQAVVSKSCDEVGVGECYKGNEAQNTNICRSVNYFKKSDCSLRDRISYCPKWSEVFVQGSSCREFYGVFSEIEKCEAITVGSGLAPDETYIVPGIPEEPVEPTQPVPVPPGEEGIITITTESIKDGEQNRSFERELVATSASPRKWDPDYKLTMSVNLSPAWFNFYQQSCTESSGKIVCKYKGLPGYGDSSLYTLTVTVSDNKGATSSKDFSFRIFR